MGNTRGLFLKKLTIIMCIYRIKHKYLINLSKRLTAKSLFSGVVILAQVQIFRHLRGDN